MAPDVLCTFAVRQRVFDHGQLATIFRDLLLRSKFRTSRTHKAPLSKQARALETMVRLPCDSRHHKAWPACLLELLSQLDGSSTNWFKRDGWMHGASSSFTPPVRSQQGRVRTHYNRTPSQELIVGEQQLCSLISFISECQSCHTQGLSNS